MTSSGEKFDVLALIKRAINTIKTLKKQALSRNNEPIAIIAMSCRFPGGSDTPEKFWEFLKQGKDGAIEVPKERFDVNEYYDPNPETKGKIYLREASFLQEDISLFDTGFFGISPRETIELDPQQRLLLELSWEAIERAGINPWQLKDSRTGVFIGLLTSEYGYYKPHPPESIGPYTVTGMLSSLASGRLAHYFGFHGPALTIDTACSSSLVTTHLACESLRRGECDLALSGGMSLMISPEAFVMLCKVRALAKDGRCKSFDSSADGYGRGEGGGILVLKRLSDATRDGDRILALIKGSVVNQDGPSSGLTVPNGAAQQDLIAEGLKRAELTAAEIGYFEAHGTGTPLGDPIEMQAINAVYAKTNRITPLYLGTVKANIGHLEAAAGIAALIKTVLCIQNKMIPANIHLKTLNPRIDLAAIPAEMPNEAIPWDSGDMRRHAAISSFGFSGTNAHIILAEPPVVEIEPERLDAPVLLSVSALDKTALNELASNYLSYLIASPANLNLSDLCFTANTGRASFSERLVFLATNKAQLESGIAAYLVARKASEFAFVSPANQETAKPAFLFLSGTVQDSQSLFTFYRSYSVFSKAFAACAEEFSSYLGADWAIRQDQSFSVYGFAIDYAYAQLLMSWGIRPSLVYGEKQGLYLAACIAEVMSLATAIACLLQEKYPDFTLSVEQLTPAKIHILSPNTGKLLKKTEVMMPSTWLNLPVENTNFAEVLKTMEENKCTVLLSCSGQELSSTSSLLTINRETDQDKVNRSLAQLYCAGLSLHWIAVYASSQFGRLILPTYPFQRKSYWVSPIKMIETTPKSSLIYNPLQGQRLTSPLPEIQFEFQLSTDRLPELNDTHNMMHVGYFLEMIKNTVRQALPMKQFKVLELAFLSAVTLTPGKAKSLYLILSPQAKQEFELSFFCRDSEALPWSLYVKGRIRLEAELNFPVVSLQALAKLKQQALKLFNATAFYEAMEHRGISLGESVRWVEQVWIGKNQALAQFRPTASQSITAGLWDACAQLFNAVLIDPKHEKTMYMVNSWRDFAFNDLPKENDSFYCLYHLKGLNSEQDLEGKFTLFTEQGETLAHCAYFDMKAVDARWLASLQSQSESLVRSNPDLLNTVLLEQLKELGSADRLLSLENYLLDTVAMLLVVPREELSAQESLVKYGIDSLNGLEFKNKLAEELALDVPVAVFIEGPTIAELAQIVEKLLVEQETLSVNTELDVGGASLKESAEEEPRSLWFIRNNSSNLSKLRLFCLPYGGGSASLYKDWQKKMPAELAVVPIQLPGRENRFQESPINNIDEMVDTLYEAIIPELGGDHALYGHSAGALIAWRLARKLGENEQYKAHCKRLFVGAYTAPLIYPNPWYQQFLNKLHQAGFQRVPNSDDLIHCSAEQLELFTDLVELELNVNQFKESKHNLDFIKLLLSKFLADLNLVGSFQFNKDEKPITIPITACHGIDDDRVTMAGMQNWQNLTSADFNLVCFPGNHFFLHANQAQDDLIAMIKKELGF